MKSFNALWAGWMLGILWSEPKDNVVKLIACIILGFAVIGWWIADWDERRAATQKEKA